MNPSMILGIVLIGSLLFNFFLGYKLSESNSIIDQAEQANDEWVQQIVKKENEIDAVTFQFNILLEELMLQGEKLAKMHEESDNAKRRLKEKNIAGNAANWLKNDPVGFRDSATNGSNRVLANIVKVSSGNKGSGSNRGAEKGQLSDASNP